ncbi:MAG: autotransporter domain-containing protein [Alphaproteobacteria bacterium]|nr:autotransporter domain-containing protein [Alphaproteobacteria bacterium]
MSFTTSRSINVTPVAFVLSVAVLYATPVLADDLTISDNRTTAADTATGDGNGAGDIIIDGNGNVELTNGPAIILNSDNSVTNGGAIQLTSESDATGILVDGSVGNLTGSVTNNNLISVPGPATDSNIVDTPVNNYGIRVNGPGTLTGSVVNGASGAIEVGGNSSFGIFVDTDLAGSLVNDGRITTIGDNSNSINLNGAVSGDVSNSSTINAAGVGGIGIYVGGAVTGAITNDGTINAGSGETRDIDLNIVPEKSGEAAIWIANSVGGGFLNSGNQVTEALEPGLDAEDPAAAIADANISATGSVPALRVRPGGPSGTISDVSLGAVGTGDNAFAVINQGIYTVGSSTEGIAVEGIVIEGMVSGGTTYSTTLAGGLSNDGGDIRAGTIDASALAIRIGDHATVPAINNSGDILAITTDSEEDINAGTIGTLGGDATAILVEQNGSLSSLTNTGIIRADAAGSSSSAFAIVDRAGTLTSFSNTGDVLAQIRDGSSGTTTALDVRTSNNDFTFFNSGTMEGDVYLGSGVGNDTYTVTGGSVLGTINSLGGGNDIISLSDATVTGTFQFTTGTKTASVINTTLSAGFAHTGSVIDLTVANSDWTILADAGASLRTLDIQGGTTLRIEVDGVNNRAGTLSATGTANLAADTTIIPILRNFITDQQTFTLVEAGQLNTSIVATAAVPADTSYMHNIQVISDNTNPNAILLQVTRRTAADLGLTSNMGTIYEGAAAALSADTDLFTGLAGIATQAEFEDALIQLLPDTSSAVMQAAIDQQNMALGAINRRLDRVPAVGFYRDKPSAWVQGMIHYAKRNPDGEQLGYTTWSGGIAIGVDRQVGRLARAGIAYTQLWSFPDELTSFDKPTEFSSSQLNGYLRMGDEIRNLQGSVTFGYDSFNSERKVQFDALDRTSLGDWNGYHFSTAWQLALGMRRGTLSFIPTARVQYLYLHQGSYIEDGGGNGLNLNVMGNNTDSLRGSLGLAARKAFIQENNTSFEFELRSNYTREFMTGTQDLELTFAAGGTPFILQRVGNTQGLFSLGLGVFYKNEHATVAFDYDGEKGSGYTGHTGAVTVRFRF